MEIAALISGFNPFERLEFCLTLLYSFSRNAQDSSIDTKRSLLTFFIIQILFLSFNLCTEIDVYYLWDVVDVMAQISHLK